MASAREIEDLAFIRAPQSWPNGPFLPIKKYMNHELKTAVVIYDGEEMIMFEDANIITFGLADLLRGGRYMTAEQIIADGWMVD